MPCIGKFKGFAEQHDKMTITNLHKYGRRINIIPILISYNINDNSELLSGFEVSKMIMQGNIMDERGHLKK